MGTLAQQKWLTKLLGYVFVVDYKKGKKNQAADALSRRDCGSDNLDQGASLFLVLHG